MDGTFVLCAFPPCSNFPKLLLCMFNVSATKSHGARCRLHLHLALTAFMHLQHLQKEARNSLKVVMSKAGPLHYGITRLCWKQKHCRLLATRTSEADCAIAALQPMLRLRTCSMSWCDVLQDDSLCVSVKWICWRQVRPGSALARLMSVLLDACCLRLQYRHMYAVGHGPSHHVIVDWRRQTFSATRHQLSCYASVHPVYEQAGFDVAVSSDIRAVVLGVKNMIRNS